MRDLTCKDGVNRYKYEEERHGQAVVRMLSFKDNKECKLGETPIPGGERNRRT